jgi:hypothetical protein
MIAGFVVVTMPLTVARAFVPQRQAIGIVDAGATAAGIGLQIRELMKRKRRRS